MDSANLSTENPPLLEDYHPGDEHILTASAQEPTPETPAPSKKAQKKAQKAALFAERKLERRAREREAKKEKKRQRAVRIAAGEEVEDDERASKRAKTGGRKTPFNARVVVDLGFDDKMSEKEITSLCSQLAYTYSANRRSPTPFTSLLFTSLNGRTFTRLEGMNDAGYKRWAGTEWWEASYDDLWSVPKVPIAEPSEGIAREAPALDQTVSAKGLAPSRSAAAKEGVVYLTADSSDELTELKEGETYIIGGICDHNRFKNLCLNKANESGIRAVQLPIGRYLSHLPTRKVLTVNQVFEILVKWTETRDWEQALYAVIPKRKFQAGGNGAQGVEIGDDSFREDGGEESKEGAGVTDGVSIS